MKLKSKLFWILSGIVAALVLNMGFVSLVEADGYIMRVVSSFEDPVSDSSSGPFYSATNAYLAGRQEPRDDGGLDKYVRLEGAYWIWMGEFIGDMSHPLYFPKSFVIPEGASNIIGTMEITADNLFYFSVNGVDYGGTFPVVGEIQEEWRHIHTYSVENLVCGMNNIFITAWEWGPGSPSGLIYKLTISYDLLIEATVEIKPETINLKSHGVFTAFVTLPSEYDVREIDINTIQCEGALALSGNVIGDTLAITFDREDLTGVNVGDEVVFTVTGNLYDGKSFSGTDLVRVISPGKK